MFLASRQCDSKILWSDGVLFEVNPFTPESDQCQNSPAASQEIWHHTVWRTWLFIAYSDEKWLYYKFSLHHSYNRFLKGWENTLFELRSERVNIECNHNSVFCFFCLPAAWCQTFLTLSLPWVINFKFALQPHSMKNVVFQSLLRCQMKDNDTTNSHSYIFRISLEISHLSCRYNYIIRTSTHYLNWNEIIHHLTVAQGHSYVQVAFQF